MMGLAGFSLAACKVGMAFVLSADFHGLLQSFFSQFVNVTCSYLPFVTEPENKQLSVCSVTGHPGGIRSNSHSPRTRHGWLPICPLYFLR